MSILDKIKTSLNLNIEHDVKFPHNDNLHFIKISDNNGNSVIMCEETLDCASKNPQFGETRIINDMRERFRIGVPVSAFDAINLDYEDIKSMISVTLFPLLNHLTSDDAVIKLGDLALTPFVDGNPAKCIITKQHLDKWGVTLNDVLMTAKENQIMDIELRPVIPPVHMFRCDNTWGNAAIIIAPDVIADVCSQNDTSVFFYLTSQNECMVFPTTADTLNDEELINMVKTLGETIDAGKHQSVSHNVYTYNHKTQTFTFCDDEFSLDFIKRMFA